MKSAEQKAKNVPAIRFAGFDDEWEKLSFADVGNVCMCKRVFKEETSDKGDIPFYKIGTFGGIPDAYITKELYNEYRTKFSYPEKGDILLSAAGTIGRIVEYDGECAYFQDSNIVWLSHDKSITNKFLKVLYPTLKWGGIEGSTIQRLYNDIFLKTSFFKPTISEQQKIGSFFSNIDSLISLEQKKYDKLTQVKKSMLEKMFPKEGTAVPEIRFAGFTGDWEEKKLSEIAVMHARIGWQNLRTSEFLDSGEYMLITGTDFQDGVINFKTCHYVEKERYDQDKHIQIKNGSILITKDGTLGKVAFVDGLKKPATLNAGVFNVENQDDVDGRYLFQYLKAPFLMDYVSLKATGGTIKHLNQNILVDFPVKLPSKSEQQKIGSYFSHLDSLISLQQRKLEKLKNIKKSLLEKMFV